MSPQALLLLATLALPMGTWAQTVGLSGLLGSKSLLVVDGGAPKAMAPGESLGGVKVISVQGDQAVIEIAGQRQTLRLGETPNSVGTGAGAESGGRRVVLTAGEGGHFFTQGQINGRTVQLVVDTGATSVAMGVSDAQRIGLKYETGRLVRVSTANGTVPAYLVRLQSVRLGDVVVYDLDALVSPSSMPYVLLGNSFLSRFQMTRTNDQMVLEKRF